MADAAVDVACVNGPRNIILAGGPCSKKEQCYPPGGNGRHVCSSISLCEGWKEFPLTASERNIILAGDERSLQMIQKLSAETPSILRTKRLKNRDRKWRVLKLLGYLAQRRNNAIHQAGMEGMCVLQSADKIVAHSRGRVDFQTAVERVARRIQGPAIWLEAGLSAVTKDQSPSCQQASRGIESGVY
jgi:hypothetical protein